MKKLLILFLLFLLNISASFAIEEKTTIRVGISNSAFSSYEHSNVTVVLTDVSSIIGENGTAVAIDSPGSIDVTISDGLFTVKDNNLVKIKADRGPLVITSGGKIGINGIKRKGDPAYYAGMLELRAIKPDKFNIINVLDMQSYLKGVVPNEMPVSFGLEALKAQAVAARNYANRPYKNCPNYDICDSTACQVYYGENSRMEISDKAVDMTNGIYALYNGDIILAQYSSTTSGISENYLDTFGNGVEHLPYLVSVADSKELQNMPLEEYFKTSPPSFDMKSPRYRWQQVFTRSELEDILSKTLYEQSKSGNVMPKVLPEETISNIEDIKVISRGASNKALAVEIKTSNNKKYVVKKELPIRRVFKTGNTPLFSANFIIEKQYGTDNITDDAIFKSGEAGEKVSDSLPIGFTFYGAGFGHGVGMSQYGAGYLSGYGVDFQGILKHYYTGITIGTVPKTVAYNSINSYYIQEFYFEKNNTASKQENLSKSPMKSEIEAILNDSKKRKCYLVIENPDKVSQIEFFINEHYFSPEVMHFNSKTMKTDITAYLNDGLNKIFFKPLTEQDKRKTVKFYVTLEESHG